jgi:hypothetical protein
VLQVGVLSVEHPMAEMLGLGSLTAGGGNVMNAWSEYLRGQAVIADRYAKTMTRLRPSRSSPISPRASAMTPTDENPLQILMAPRTALLRIPASPLCA